MRRPSFSMQAKICAAKMNKCLSLSGVLHIYSNRNEVTFAELNFAPTMSYFARLGVREKKNTHTHANVQLYYT